MLSARRSNLILLRPLSSSHIRQLHAAVPLRARVKTELKDSVVSVEKVQQIIGKRNKGIQPVTKESPAPECSLYNQMLDKHVKQGDVDRALEVFGKMKNSGVEPNSETYDLMVKACLQNKDLSKNFASLFNVHDQQAMAAPIVSSASLPISYEHEKIFQLWTDCLVDERVEQGVVEEPAEKTQSDLFMQQLMLEKASFEQSVAKYRKIIENENESGRGANLGPSQRMIAEWFPVMVDAIKKEQDAVRCGESSPDREVLGPIILALKPELMAVMTLHTVMNYCLTYPSGANISTISKDIGRFLQAEHNAQALKKNKLIFRELVNMSQKQRMSVLVPFVNTRAARLLADAHAWDDSLVLKLGGLLVQLVLDHVTVATSGGHVPAFRHTYETVCKKQLRLVGVLQPHERLLEIIQYNFDRSELSSVTHQPMLVPPKPWLSYDIGGFLSQRVSVMRFSGPEQRKALEEKEHQVTQVYKALSALGAVPWRVNNRVFQVIGKLWETGGGVGKLPTRKDIALPECPDPALLEIPRDQMTEEQLVVYKTWRRQWFKIKRHNANLHSMRCDVVYRLEGAKRFLDRTLYFPHNMDFRGRAYPIPQHLNHMGSDLSRSLLWFAEPRPIGPNGLFWLKVLLANVYGKDKMSLQAREAFIDSVLDDVLDSADNPLTGRRWWQHGENPFQCLAACFCVADATRMARPEEYMCQLPVQLDGSCNGLQHYAALGRDEAGGYAVNLVHSGEDKPQDVYSKVLEQVVLQVHQDALAGHPIAQLLDGIVDRKVVKQTVMTSVYGVTFVGARDQIKNRLTERNMIAEEMVFDASMYLAKHTLSGLRQLFSAAFQIMDWLRTCSRLISQAGEPTAWTTPLGLPVVQPYRQTSPRVVNTVLQSISVPTRPVNATISCRRNVSAFPPNFVHSLDSTHMLLTGLECEQQGITFASVHDSFWTHPADVDRLNTILREQFLKLHEIPLLENLHDEFTKLHPSITFPPVPERGALDLKKVLKSTYFFA